MPRSLLRWLCSGADGVAGQCVDAGWLSGDIWTSDAFSGSIWTPEGLSGDISPVLSLGAYRSCPTTHGIADCCPRTPGASDCRPKTLQASGCRPRTQCPCKQTAARAAGWQQSVCPPVRFTKKGPAKPGLSGVFECEASASPPMRSSATSRRGCRSQSS